MNIIRACLATALVLFLFPFTSSAQKTGPAQEEFYNSFASAYLEISKPPLQNYFTHLDNALKFTFATENEFFVPALAEIKARYSIDETDASDSLFLYSINKLVKEKLWGNYAEAYTEYEQAFKGYEQALCPCITAKFKPTDEVDKMMPILQDCVGRLATDTAAANSIRRYAGDKTLNDIFANQQYFALYIYQHCDVVKQFFNDILRSQANGHYKNTLAVAKRRLAQNVLNYYEDKKTDSLAIIFPAYKKYSSELNAALALAQKGGTRTQVRYSVMSAGTNDQATIYLSSEAQWGDFKITFSNPGVDAIITKITFKKTAVRPNAGEQIIEIREDKVMPGKQ